MFLLLSVMLLGCGTILMPQMRREDLSGCGGMSKKSDQRYMDIVTAASSSRSSVGQDDMCRMPLVRDRNKSLRRNDRIETCRYPVNAP